ncbi:kelch repeat-containing protein [Cupriavidus agavae]|uniref:Kelch motif protein n=1 Tax=Cupriavidus agavae TaxID=1001822 RepID=A0A4Q7RWC7_9BURK|nr:kelch repeat-containing protein [Cupriavidus agavae]RZT36612.1 Kelch motif protein [Cupriavidus agavae]
MPNHLSREHSRGASFFRLFLLIGLTLWLAACVGDEDSADGLQPPAGLSYAMPDSVYEVGTAIVPNRPNASGGAVDRFTVAPALPAGLALDPATGLITGTPAAVSAAAAYVVTAQNAAGSATTRLQIAVKASAVAPASLQYRDQSVVYTLGVAIPANAPTSTGGAITAYAISPALPAGLVIDALTGMISGTPSAESVATPYTVTGSNAAGSVTTTLTLSVQRPVLPPASLTYPAPTLSLTRGVAMTAVLPSLTGGAADTYSVSPALPAGLSLNTATGAVSGTPAASQSQTPYVITARNGGGAAQATLRITVISPGSWTTAAPMLTPAHYLTTTVLLDGRVLQTGGYTTGGVTANAALYDPAADAWLATAPMAVPRSGHTATLLADGRVLVAGGSQGPSTQTASAEIYNPATNTWTPAANMAEARESHSATLLPNGKVLIAGGHTQPGATLFSDTVEIFDPTTNTWTMAATRMASARSQHGSALSTDGAQVILIGGVNTTGFVMQAELFPVDGVSPTATVPLPGAGGNVTLAARLPNGNVLAINDAAATGWVLDPVARTWTSSTMNAQRALPSMTLLSDGNVLVAGGAIGGSGLTSAELYDPVTNIWTPAASMAAGRRAGTAVALPNGQALVVGGFNGSAEVGIVERFVP